MPELSLEDCIYNKVQHHRTQTVLGPSNEPLSQALIMNESPNPVYYHRDSPKQRKSDLTSSGSLLSERIFPSYCISV